MQAASRAVSTECHTAGAPRSSQVLPVGLDMAMSFNHQHSGGPWHFGIAAVRHVVQAPCLFFFFFLGSHYK